MSRAKRTGLDREAPCQVAFSSSQALVAYMQALLLVSGTLLSQGVVICLCSLCCAGCCAVMACLYSESFESRCTLTLVHGMD